MTIPHSIKRDKWKRALLSKRMVPQLVHKVVCHDRSMRSSAHKKRARLLHHSSENAIQTQIRNRCILSGRGKGVYKFCKLSRIQIRQCAERGLLAGVTKASW